MEEDAPASTVQHPEHFKRRIAGSDPSLTGHRHPFLCQFTRLRSSSPRWHLSFAYCQDTSWQNVKALRLFLILTCWRLEEISHDSSATTDHAILRWHLLPAKCWTWQHSKGGLSVKWHFVAFHVPRGCQQKWPFAAKSGTNHSSALSTLIERPQILHRTSFACSCSVRLWHKHLLANLWKFLVKRQRHTAST